MLKKFVGGNSDSRNRCGFCAQDISAERYRDTPAFNRCGDLLIRESAFGSDKKCDSTRIRRGLSFANLTQDCLNMLSCIWLCEG